jgi:broad specificity phosphatase PhoE
MLLLRHGQTTWNAERRWQGWADAPLSELGEQQALDAGAHLVGFGFTRVCSSDLSRARRTAELLAESLSIGGHVFVDAGIREHGVGVFQGRLSSELQLEYPECFDPDRSRRKPIPEAEDPDVFLDRVVAGLLGLVERFPTDELLVISHGGVIGTLERHLGIDRGSSVPNLGGRWLTVDPAAGSIVGGDAFTPVEPELVTAPATE